MESDTRRTINSGYILTDRAVPSQSKFNHYRTIYLLSLVLTLILVLVVVPACAQRDATPSPRSTTDEGEKAGPSEGTDARLRIGASTTIIGDVVRNVAGDVADVTVLLPAGADPHSFEPTPQDVARISKVNVLFINGLGLEQSLSPLLKSIEGQTPAVALAEQAESRRILDEVRVREGENSHVWFDPKVVIAWTHVIEETLRELDPANADVYTANAEVYRHELDALDSWIAEEVAQFPVERRVLVTDHAVLGYFAARYGFEQVGTLSPGASTLAEPSAGDIAALKQAIAQYDVPAIFVGATVSPRLAEQIALDTGIAVYRLYTGSLSAEDGPAATYIQYMRYNVLTIVEALQR